MEYYLKKYLGKYRLIASIDESSGDYCRDIKGNYCNANDIFIRCAKGVLVWHVGQDVLQVYIPSIKRGNIIIKQINPDLIFDIEQTDEETLFKIKDKNFHEIVQHIKPQISGASITPFSVKNIKKEISKPITVLNNNQLTEYIEITSAVPKKDKLFIMKINNSFKEDFLSYILGLEVDEINADMKKKNMKAKDYFCHVGYWNDYINCLKMEVIKKYGNRN